LSLNVTLKTHTHSGRSDANGYIETDNFLVAFSVSFIDLIGNEMNKKLLAFFIISCSYPHMCVFATALAIHSFAILSGKKT
jgi:hypothetical protein